MALHLTMDHAEGFHTWPHSPVVPEEWDTDSEAWVADGRFGVISGTDMHSPDYVSGWTGLNITEFTEEAVMVQLRARNTTVFYSEEGHADETPMYKNPEFDLLFLSMVSI